MRALLAAVLALLLSGAVFAQDTSVPAQLDALRRRTDLAGSPERILSFASHIVVKPDASLDVTETIALNATGQSIRHGILRDFPTRYRDARGNPVTIGFSVLAVTRDGRDEPYAIESLDNGQRIRIGDKETDIAPGPVIYQIRYRATRELGFFADGDELYWNVTGNGWTYAIDEARVTVDLPDGARVLRSALYTGRAGSQASEAVTEPAGPGHFAARTTRALDAGEGFTVAVLWPKGFVTEPGAAAHALWFLQDEAPALIAWLGALGVAAYYLRTWRRVGRDPEAGVIVPLFRPPDNLSAAAARYVRRQGFDAKTFSSAILGLAVKGHLRIAEGKAGYRFEPKDAPRAGLSPGEAGLLAALGASPIDLTNTNHVRIGAARDALAQALATEHLGATFVLNRVWFYIGAGASALVMALAYLSASHDVANGLVLGGFLVTWWGVIALMGRLMLGAIATGGWWERLRGALGLLFLLPFLAVGLGAPILAIVLDAVPPDLVVAALGCAVLAGLNIAFFFLLTAPTVAGRALLDRIEGFRLYLATTEEDRLNVLHPPTRTPDLFERYLPYAVALDCAHQWSRMFTTVLSAAGVAAPTWYSGSNWSAANPARFATHLDGSLATSAAAAASPPGSSSGSGGGGSSGGGGGGGGGSGW